MYKLLIVDDEKHIRDALSTLVNWEEIGIGAVETARNGYAALETAGQLGPHIVLCDIRMPKMDGIEFAAVLRQVQPHAKLIFLSGYAEKEYLKSAIRLKAFRFIEKPIVLDEVKAVIAEAVEAVRNEEHAGETERGTLAFMQEHTAVLIGNAVNELVRPDSDWRATAGKLNRLGCPMPCAGPVLPAAVRLIWDEFVDESERDEIRQSLLTWLNRDCGRSGAIAGYHRQDMLILLLKCSSAEVQAAYLEHDRLINSLNTGLPAGMQALAGIGPVAASPDQLPEAFQDAKHAARLLFYREQDNIRFAGGLAGCRFELGQDVYTGLWEMLKKGDTAEARALIDRCGKLAMQCEDPDIDHVKNAFFLMILIILDLAKGSHVQAILGRADKSYIWARLEKVDSLQELTDYTVDFLSAADATEDAVRCTLNKILTYIGENYMRSDLTMETIARQAHFSQSYICSIFKKAMGKTLNEYTTEMRIEKARELLRNGSMKLYMVAQRSGFNDANYFSTIFKRITGKTPSEFREGL